ncbi:hypothetical protein PMIN06_005355 [Paraphaeosphaeria minitans]
MTYLQRWWWEVAGRKSGKGKLAPHEAKNGAREPVLRAIESSVCDGAWCESRGVASWSDLSGAAAMGRRQWVGHERVGVSLVLWLVWDAGRNRRLHAADVPRQPFCD